MTFSSRQRKQGMRQVRPELEDRGDRTVALWDKCGRALQRTGGGKVEPVDKGLERPDCDTSRQTGK